MQGEIRLRRAALPEMSAGRMADTLGGLLQASSLLGLPETEEQLRLALLTLWTKASLAPRH